LLRERAAAEGSQRARAEVPALANLVVSVIDGRLSQFVRTEFRVSPCTNFDDQWQILIRPA
jgi:TetR/AcrR family transcriptional regulator